MYNKFASDSNCNEKHAVACEKEVNMFNEDVEYTSYKGCNSFAASHAICQKHGKKLAKIKSRNEQAKFSALTESPAWIDIKISD